MSATCRRLLLVCALMLLVCCRTMADKCTNVCVCKWKSGKQTVECRNRGLNGVPDGIDPETQVLDASENAINFLTDGIFIKVRLTNLQRLYLRSCRIDRIEQNALAGLTNLVELDLSHNRLTSVPSQSFANAPFLRDLVLAHNPIGKIPPHAFKDAPNLVKLDLSNCDLTDLAAKGFQGLDMLETLKLSHNRISTLLQHTFEPLNKLTSIELHENPWTCDCTLREMKSWLVKHNLPTLIAPICQRPEQLANRSFAELTADDFACRPVMAIVSRYAEATIGENASIVCTVTAIPPAKIKWIWNGKLYTNHSIVNSYQKILIYEEGKHFQKRSTLVLTNAQETDSSNFFCVAENQAGSVEANFTLHVSLRTAGMSTLGSGQIAGISAALVVLILFILLTIMVLFVRLRRMPQKEVKSPAPGSDNLPLDGCTSSNQDSGANNPQSATSTVSRRKLEEVETTSFNESLCAGKPAGGNAMPLNHSYAPRPVAASLLPTESHDYLINRGYDDGSSSRTLHQSILAAGPACYSSQASLMPVDNPDLIRDTRRGSSDEAAIASYASGEYSSSRLLDMDEGKLLYSECLSWEATGSRALPSVSANPYKDLHQPHQQAQPQQQQQQQQQQQDSFPPGAKQIRVWQKQGVPVLPPVSALKRVLSTRSSPDEGYQEGTGTDV
ncbi:leucine-rich repeat-containing protein 24 [Nasonia vitripennis]|uniref:Ig-like domain-containing protein n=1 Tax=Nasonia vitripennis TaxID=7425 RepID=A0A7M7Q2Y3_NASVI|nr:leucine-rich repeat-containing protein 24 [Nasonia vitripennis]